MSSKSTDSGKSSITDIQCYKCKLFLEEGEEFINIYGVAFHEGCFNRYEHYYGLDRPID